jgi:casein kinase II subunit alpha
VLGTDDLEAYVQKYGITIPKDTLKVLRPCKKVPWESFVNSGNEELCTPEALDLLSKLMLYDHVE